MAFQVGSRVQAHSDGNGWQAGQIVAPPQGNGNLVPVKFDVNGQILPVPLNLLRLEQKKPQQQASGRLAPGQRVTAKSDQGSQSGTVVAHEGDVVKIKFDVNGQTYPVPQNLVILEGGSTGAGGLPAWMTARGTKGYMGNDIDDYGEYDDNEGGHAGSGMNMAAGGASGKRHPFKLGMCVEVFSKSCGGWMPGRVMEFDANVETPYIDVDYSDQHSNFEAAGFDDALRLMSKKLRLFDPALQTKLRPSAETPRHPPYKPRDKSSSRGGGSRRNDNGGGMGGGRSSGGGFGGGGGPQRRPGDWDCPKCNAMNFASRERCYKCNAVKPGGLMDSRGPTNKFGGNGASLFFD